MSNRLQYFVCYPCVGLLAGLWLCWLGSTLLGQHIIGCYGLAAVVGALFGLSFVLARAERFFILVALIFVGTIALMVIVTISLPTSEELLTCTIKQRDVVHDYPACFTNWPLSLPCRIATAMTLLCLDQFNMWEAAALLQTSAMAVLLFWRADEGPGIKQVFGLSFLVLGSTVFCLFCTLDRIWLAHAWKWQLWTTLIFLIAVLLADIGMLVQERFRRHLHSGVGHFDDHLWSDIVRYADMPMLISNAILAFLLMDYNTPSHHVFFSGATAFGLIFANALILIIEAVDIYGRFGRILHEVGAKWQT